ncbi:MAG TPA: hydrogenase formation protein HypD, partial [bacterium]|nr:hydrogenase formation protein HypD [bacterium]
MRFQDLHEAFRQQQLTQRLAHSIRHLLNGQTVRFMEVCGGHTAAVLRFGIQALLPDSIQLLSGPGCPVCVTPQVVVRQSLEVADRDDSLLATFGDMMRVPSTDGSLEDARARGASIRVIYSPLDVLDLARENPLKKVVLLAIGFETTAPATAKLLLEAERANVKNLFVLCAHKTMPEAMSWLLE